MQNDNKQRILNETFKRAFVSSVPKRFCANASDADYINKCFDPCQFEVLYIVLIYLYILSYSIITISPNIRLIMYSRPLDEKKEKTNAGKQSSFIGNLMIDPRWWMMKFNIFIFQLLILTYKNKICVCYEATYLGSFFGYIYVVVKKVCGGILLL